jgi:hypothetical protein
MSCNSFALLYGFRAQGSDLAAPGSRTSRYFRRSLHRHNHFCLIDSGLDNGSCLDMLSNLRGFHLTTAPKATAEAPMTMNCCEASIVARIKKVERGKTELVSASPALLPASTGRVSYLCQHHSLSRLTSVPFCCDSSVMSNGYLLGSKFNCGAVAESERGGTVTLWR